MAFIEYAVEELSSPLKIEDSVIAYAEAQMGPQRNTRLAQAYDRVRLGLQTSPENFFYNEGQWTGAPYVNLNALEFTSLAGTAEALAYDTAPGTELFAVEGGTPAEIGPPAVDAVVTGKLKLKVNELLIEQVEVREGDTYMVCDAAGDPVETTIHQIHLSLKSSNKPDFTFYEWHPQARYRFNRQCNLITDMTDETMAVAYHGDNNYILSPALFEATLAVVEGL
jgi:hypothetical protein